MKKKTQIDVLAALPNITDVPALPGFKAVKDDAYVYIQGPDGSMRYIPLKSPIWCSLLTVKK
ncbi:MAG TPA: hypothetical protein VN519_06500 [Bryobacteraceae bacterium]|nr:hypothetical protein [Bryobacteraceae bacterium]